MKQLLLLLSFIGLSLATSAQVEVNRHGQLVTGSNTSGFGGLASASSADASPNLIEPVQALDRIDAYKGMTIENGGDA